LYIVMNKYIRSKKSAGKKFHIAVLKIRVERTFYSTEIYGW